MSPTERVMFYSQFCMISFIFTVMFTYFIVNFIAELVP